VVVAQFLDAALAQANRGRVVVPACADPCTVPWHDTPCPGKRPLVKIKDRDSITAAEVRRLWRRWPDATLAILTGARSDLVVVDLDGPEGEAALARAAAVLGQLPDTLMVKTKRGRHLWFRHPGGKVLTRKGDDFYPAGREQGNAHGLDVRGDGGLVIAPPSPNRVYANDLEPAELPESWVVALSTGTSAAPPLRGEDLDQGLESVRTEGDPCPCMERVLDKYGEESKNGRHGAMVNAQHALVMLGREQHPGAGQALDRLQELVLADKPDGEGEWSRGLDGAVSIAMAKEPETTGCVYVVKEHLGDRFELAGEAKDDDGPSLGQLLDNYAAQKEAEREQTKEKENPIQKGMEQEATRLYIREGGRRLYESRIAEGLPDPELTSLADLLAEPDDDPTYRVDGLWPTGGNVILAAARKAGKTTMVGNLVRSLVDGDAFLGVPGPVHVNGYDVVQVDGMVAVLDLELDRRMLRRWLRDQGIAGQDRVMAESLRGRAHLFDVLDDTRRGKWAKLLANYGVKVLILDPLGALLDAYGRDENSNSDVGPVLQALDQLKAEAGIEELLLAHHMGHNGERSRGASKLRGWPDAEWFLVRERAKNGEEPPPDAARFFLAEGRDVMVPEARMEYDQATRRLWIAGGSRTQHKATKDAPAVLAIITETPGLSQREITAAAAGQDMKRDPVHAALRSLIQAGKVRTEPGPRNALRHFPAQEQAESAGPDPFAQKYGTEAGS
jgi:hypothetical protein